MSAFLLSPLTWLATAALLLVFARRLPRIVRRITQVVAVLAVFACTPLCANGLLWLAERHPQAVECSATNRDWPVVLLTAGFDRSPRDIDDAAALNKENFERMDIAWRLLQADPAAALHVSGGGSEGIPEAVVVYRLLERRGIPARRMALETRSLTTWENAFALRATLHHARLVTSPAHQQRAAMAFRAAGIETCAVPAPGGVIAPDGIGYVLPRRSALAKTEQALHELVGRVAYTWRSRGVHAASNRS